MKIGKRNEKKEAITNIPLQLNLLSQIIILLARPTNQEIDELIIPIIATQPSTPGN